MGRREDSFRQHPSNCWKENKPCVGGGRGRSGRPVSRHSTPWSTHSWVGPEPTGSGPSIRLGNTQPGRVESSGQAGRGESGLQQGVAVRDVGSSIRHQVSQSPRQPWDLFVHLPGSPFSHPK